MESREKSREERIRKITGREMKPGMELQEAIQAQNEVAGINSELQNNLAMEQGAAQARMANNQVLQSAAMMAASGMVGGAAGGAVGAVVGQGTRNTLAKYMGKPQPPKTSMSSQTNKSGGVVQSSSGGITNIKNETITNTTNNSRTEIRVVQPDIPIKQPQIVVGPQQNQNNTAAQFKAWLAGIFAKQQNDYEIQKKEYRKREWNLNRSANRMMRRIEQATKSFGQKMDPKVMGSTIGGQLKTLLFLIGGTLIVKWWKPIMGKIASIEGGIRTAFGLPMNDDLTKRSGKSLSLIDSIKKAIGIDPHSAEGKETTLIKGIGKVFSEGIDKLIKRIDLWMKDRQIALKTITAPEMSVPKVGGKWGFLVNPITSALSGVFSELSGYLGDLVSAALGGSGGNLAKKTRNLRKAAYSALESLEGAKGGYDSSSSTNRRARSSDFDIMGDLKSGPGSTLSVSNSITSMLTDTSNIKQTGAVATGLEQLNGVAKRSGKAYINPDLLRKLGVSEFDLQNLYRTGELVPEEYKLVKIGKNQGSFRKFVGTNKNYDYYDVRSNEYFRIIPANSEELGYDGSKPIKKTYYALTKEGFDRLKQIVGFSGEMDLKNKEFLDWTSGILERQKRVLGVQGDLVEANQGALTDYDAVWSRRQAYLGEVAKLNGSDQFQHWNAATTTIKNAAHHAVTWTKTEISDLMRSSAKKLTKEEQKANTLAAMKYFIGKGLTKEQAAGVVGNLLGESQMDPKAENPVEKGRGYKGYGRGIAQWSNERVGQFKSWHRQTYGEELEPHEAPLDHQLGFVWAEMNSRPALMEALSSGENAIAATDSVLRGFENGSAKALASPEQLDSVYSRAATKNSYKDMMKARTGFSLAALDLYEKDQELKEETTMEKFEKGTAGALNSLADWIDPRTIKPEATKESMTPEGDALEAKQTKWRNNFWSTLYGAKTDSSGTYIDTAGSRVYINTSQTSWNMAPSSISYVSARTTGGLLDNGDSSDIAKAGAMIDLNDLLYSYEGKGGSSDYMTDNGEKRYIYIGEFTDLSREALHNEGLKHIENVESRVTAGSRKAGVRYYIRYWVLFSKNGSRVVEILTDKIKLPYLLDGQPKYASGILYKENSFTDPKTKEKLSWNPEYTSLGIGLTKEAKKVITYLKMLFSGNYKDKDSYLEQIGYKSMSESEKSLINDAVNGSGMFKGSGQLSNYGQSIYDLKGKFDRDRLWKAIGAESEEDLAKQFEVNPDSFVIDSGQVYDKISGLLIGRVGEDGKFSAESQEGIQEWLGNNQSMPDIIRRGAVRDSKSAELRAKGLLGATNTFRLTKDVYDIAGDLDKNQNNEDFLKWAGEKNKGIEFKISRNVGGFRFEFLLDSTGRKILKFRPKTESDGVYWRLVKSDGTLSSGAGKAWTKRIDWIDIEKLNNPTERAKILNEYLEHGSSGTANEGRAIVTDKDNGSLLAAFYKNASNVLQGIPVDESKISLGTQAKYQEFGERLRDEYAANKALAVNQDWQRFLEDQAGQYMNGTEEERAAKFINESGRIFTRSEHLQIGNVDEEGNFTKATGSESFQSMKEGMNLSKDQLYSLWFGAQTDEYGETYVQQGNYRIYLDMSKPVTRDIRRIIKDIKQPKANIKGTFLGNLARGTSWAWDNVLAPVGSGTLGALVAGGGIVASGGTATPAAAAAGVLAGSASLLWAEKNNPIRYYGLDKVDEDTIWESATDYRADANGNYMKGKKLVEAGEESQLKTAILDSLDEQIKAHQETIDQNEEWYALLAKNDGDVAKALQEQAEMEYEGQELAEKMLEQAVDQTKIAVDTLTTLRAVAEHHDVDMEGLTMLSDKSKNLEHLGYGKAIAAAVKEKEEEMAAQKAEEDKKTSDKKAEVFAENLKKHGQPTYQPVFNRGGDTQTTINVSVGTGSTACAMSAANESNP